LVPDGVRVDFVKSGFDGALPGHFGGGHVGHGFGGFWWRDGTKSAPAGLNDLNRETPEFYVCCHRVGQISTNSIHPDTCRIL
jgi:alpha-1,2-mannosyltransferase